MPGIDRQSGRSSEQISPQERISVEHGAGRGGEGATTRGVRSSDPPSGPERSCGAGAIKTDNRAQTQEEGPLARTSADRPSVAEQDGSVIGLKTRTIQGQPRRHHQTGGQSSVPV